MHFYTIYTIDTWFMLSINNPTLKYIYYSWVYHTIIIRQIYYNYAFDIIIPIPFIIFQTYNIISCDVSCDCDYIPLYCPKEKEKSNQEK